MKNLKEQQKEIRLHVKRIKITGKLNGNNTNEKGGEVSNSNQKERADLRSNKQNNEYNNFKYQLKQDSDTKKKETEKRERERERERESRRPKKGKTS